MVSLVVTTSMWEDSFSPRNWSSTRRRMGLGPAEIPSASPRSSLAWAESQYLEEGPLKKT